MCARRDVVCRRLVRISACAWLCALAPVRAGLAYDEILVTNSSSGDSITVYPRAASGDVSPLRQVVGFATNLDAVEELDYDPIHDEIFVASELTPGRSFSAIDVFPRSANGNASPIRVLSGSTTGLIGSETPFVDVQHDELWVADSDVPSVRVFRRSASGDAAPLRTIAGALTGLDDAQGLAVDVANDEVFVANGGSSSPPAGFINVYARTASGNVAPLRTIGGAATRLSSPEGLQVDTLHDELFVADNDGGVSVFARTANGNVAPLRRIAGPLTGLDNDVESLVLDTTHDELFVVVTDFNATRIAVFPRTANGNVAPVRTISGPHTNLSSSQGIRLTTCLQSATNLCLSNGRFSVSAVWTTRDGRSGVGHVVQLTPDTGYLWFFNPSNVEVVAKVIDGCALNNAAWFFAGGLTNVNTVITVADSHTGVVKTYTNPQGTAFHPIQDTGAFPTCATADATTPELPAEAARQEPVASAPLASAAAAPSVAGSSLLLNNDRFRVDVTWRTSDARTGTGNPVALTGDTGYFWFFAASNVEMVVKVLNACAVGGRYWVFAGGLTNVHTTTTVTDTQTSRVKTYNNPLGTAFQPIQDTNAFTSCP